MGRGGAIYLSYTALVLLARFTPAAASIWTVDIDEGPAPSPEDGPPFSAHAIRNRGVLPYEVIGVVAAYLGSVLILGTLLLTIGRKLRKEAQNIVSAKPFEMVKPINRTFDPSPISLSSVNRGWYKLRSQKSSAGSMRTMGSNGAGFGNSVVTFDQNVIDHDRERMQDNLADIYGQVFADEGPTQDTAASTNSETKKGLRATTSKLPLLDTDLEMGRTAGSPMSLRSMQSMNSLAIPANPADSYYRSSPMSATQREPLSAIEYSEAQSPLDMTREGSSAVDSSRGDMHQTALPKRLRRPLNHLKIDSPLRRTVDDEDDARTPLSPRSYIDPGPPPQPPLPHSPRNWPIDDYSQLVAAEELDEVRELPPANPQRSLGLPYNTGPLPEPGRRANTSVVNGSGALPFRQYQNQGMPDTAASSPLSPSGRVKFDHSVKTTVVEARRDRLQPLMTGVQTPYSAYMPFTPVTPVAPHLQSRTERRQRQREQRAARGVLTEEDRVADDKDLWASGY